MMRCLGTLTARCNRRWLIVGLLAILWCAGLAPVWRISNHHDLDVFLRAAQRLSTGQDIYADAAPFQRAIEDGSFSMKDDTVIWPYAYSPLIAAMFVPPSYLPMAFVRTGWWLLNVAMLLAGSWLCLRAVGPVTADRVVLVLLLLYRFSPAVAALRLGQIEVLQFFMLALTLYALRSGHDRGAGLALGLATGLKFFPGALIAWLIWRQKWRAAIWAAACALVLTVASFALVGWDAVLGYWRYSAMYGIGGAFAAFPLNHALNGFFSRNLMTNVFSASLRGWDLPALARGLTVMSDLVIVGACACLTWRGLRPRPQAMAVKDTWRDPLEFGLAVMALLLVSPHSQVYSFVWALLALIVWGMYLRANSATRWWHWGGLLVCYLLLGRDYQLYIPGLTRLVQAHYTFGALLLWGLLARDLWKERRQSLGLQR